MDAYHKVMNFVEIGGASERLMETTTGNERNVKQNNGSDSYIKFPALSARLPSKQTDWMEE